MQEFKGVKGDLRVDTKSVLELSFFCRYLGQDVSLVR